jgi:acyl-coenzyme A thioesterase PaaI-like protein
MFLTQSLQEQYAPHNACFGCGPSNEKGLKLRSFIDTTAKIPETFGLIATWTPQSHHEAFPGVLNGGIIGALLDCHSNWTAAWYLMTQLGLLTPPCTVTADFHIRLKRPTPTPGTLTLRSRIERSTDSPIKASDRVTVTAELLGADNRVYATCLGHFVAVKPGHPAYHRW